MSSELLILGANRRDGFGRGVKKCICVGNLIWLSALFLARRDYGHDGFDFKLGIQSDVVHD